MPKPRVAPTTASITLNGKTGTSRYGKSSGPSGRRRQPTNAAQSAFRITGWFGMVFPSITPGLGYYAAGSEPVNSAQGDPAEILENIGQTPRLEGAPVPLPAAHLAPGGKALETPACQRVTLPLNSVLKSAFL